MSEAKKLSTSNNQIPNNIKSDKSTLIRVNETHTAELVIGICSQIGSNKEIVIDEIKEQLKEYNYTFKNLKLGDYISGDEIDLEYKNNSNTEEYNTYLNKIKKGNKLRELKGKDYLANRAISVIADGKVKEYDIKSDSDFSNVKSQRICYIVDSIKHKEELQTLKNVYGDIFYLVSVFTPKRERIKNISIPNITQNEAKKLIEIDEYEVQDSNGQQVRKVYVEADFFIKVEKNTENKVANKIKRFINLIFENEIVTPTIHERAMFEAKSASVNSACLSRQVGASIISKDGELLSIGWNDVPKYGGNLYTSESKVDNRCYKKGKCFNDSNKKTIKDVIKSEFKQKFLVFQKENKNFDNQEKIVKLLETVLENSLIDNLIEFSRAVHAEMHAVLNAGQKNGIKLKESSLYCTTYPCHNCVRHIIASGIYKVYFIEPYVKSKGIDLHFDSITDEEIKTKNKNKVQILMFEGISPKKYLSFFKNNQPRKAKGISNCKDRDKHKLMPKNSISLQALLYREILASKRIIEKQNLNL